MSGVKSAPSRVSTRGALSAAFSGGPAGPGAAGRPGGAARVCEGGVRDPVTTPVRLDPPGTGHKGVAPRWRLTCACGAVRVVSKWPSEALRNPPCFSCSMRRVRQAVVDTLDAERAKVAALTAERDELVTCRKDLAEAQQHLANVNELLEFSGQELDASNNEVQRLRNAIETTVVDLQGRDEPGVKFRLKEALAASPKPATEPQAPAVETSVAQPGMASPPAYVSVELRNGVPTITAWTREAWDGKTPFPRTEYVVHARHAAEMSEVYGAMRALVDTRKAWDDSHDDNEAIETAEAMQAATDVAMALLAKAKR